MPQSACIQYKLGAIVQLTLAIPLQVKAQISQYGCYVLRVSCNFCAIRLPAPA